MAAPPIQVYSRSGALFYSPPDPHGGPDFLDFVTPTLYNGRGRRPHSIHIRPLPPLDAAAAAAAADRSSGKVKDKTKTLKRQKSFSERLARSRDSAKRLICCVVAPKHGSSASTAVVSGCDSPSTLEASSPRLPALVSAPLEISFDMPTAPAAEGRRTRPALREDVRADSARSSSSNNSGRSATATATGPAVAEDKPVASGNGIAVYISLAEPVLFLQGFEPSDVHTRTTTMLRGSLVVKLAKSAKIKTITLTFRGRARTEWPEGIPPKKIDFFEEETINRHTWPFFNAQFPTAEKGHCADYCRLAKPNGGSTSSLQVPGSARLGPEQFARSALLEPDCGMSKEQKRLSLQLGYSRSSGRGESGSVAQRGYRTFAAGDYVYNFELPLDSRLPESIDVDLGNVRYELEAMVERAGAFRANLIGRKDVSLIRTPSENSLETVEPIAISRNWEDQLHYDIVISGKSFPLGAQVPIAFKLTPLAKVQCHRIKVFVTENVEYNCSNKAVRRLEPTKKIQLFEKRADGPSSSAYPGSTIRILSGGGVDYDSREAAARGDENVQRDTSNLLGNLDGEQNIGPTEMEFSVQLPDCASMKEKERSQRLHSDTTFSNIQVHHWIKIVMRLSRPDRNDPGKRRHFEISIDSPFHILSCLATQANIALPAYSGRDGSSTAEVGSYECGCPGAPRQARPTSTYLNPQEALWPTAAVADDDRPAAPPMVHLNGLRLGGVQRPTQLARNPSGNPPAFDADEPPPPMTTPPPDYDTIVGEGEGLADYFARLADETATDDEDERAARARIDVPLTPGGRLNRSMDERRTWLPLGRAS